MPLRPRRTGRVLLAAVSVALVLTGLPTSATPAAAALPAPTVSLLPSEGSVEVHCGELPDPAAQFQITSTRRYRVPEQSTLGVGATNGTITVRPDSTYSVTCRSRVGNGRWGEPSPATTVRYPDLTLPVLRVDTTAAAPILSRTDYVGATVSVNPNGRRGVPALTATAKIRGRGNSTWNAPTAKKPYKLKLDAAAALLGLPADRDWALLANFYDRTMLRSSIAYGWGEASSLAWTPRTAYVELILNGDYRGVYQVAETVEIGSDRVDVDPLEKSDTTLPTLAGGYLAEIDYKPGSEFGQPDDVTHFRATISGTPFTIKDPDPPSPEQIDYLKGQIDLSENGILAAVDGAPGAYEQLGSVIDLKSYADWYVISEMARNYDAGYSSTYVYKPRDGKLTMGPLWDFDLSMGTYFFTRQPSDDLWVGARAPWFQYLLKTPQFRRLVQDRYEALRPTFRNAPDEVERLDRQIRSARARDAVRWGYDDNLPRQVDDLQRWLRLRREWFDDTYR